MDKISCLLCEILDYIGYSEEIISIRRKYWQQVIRYLNTLLQEVTVVSSGSKAEGITSIYESDIDVMHLFNDVICSNDIQHLSPVSGFTTLHADTRETPPGYTRLKMLSCHGEYSNEFLKVSSFESESSDVYISSSFFASGILLAANSNDIFGGIIQSNELSGPAVPRKLLQQWTTDHVTAFPCYYPKILQTWKIRRRHYSWPPQDVIEAAASIPAQVVPVGNKMSDDKWLQWRFCFIPSELKLTFSLNETQIKLYILLKMVTKDILKNVSKEISSYMMKNITFWLSELLPEELFRKENLINLLFLSLVFLKSCISYQNWLPYYMIPGRNLLAGRLSPKSRQQMCDLIGTLIAEGPRFIFFRCNKPRAALEALISSSTLLVDYGTRRNKIETLAYYILLSIYSENEFIIPLHLLTAELKTFVIDGIPAPIMARLLPRIFISILS